MTPGPEVDQIFMRRCAELSNHARSSGDAAVGAVIVYGGAVIAEAPEQVVARNDVAGHAELIAIQQACSVRQSRDLTGCTLYTNVEPCWMCSYAIREARISEVVIGRQIEDTGGATSRYPILTDANVPGWASPPILRWFPAGE